MSLDNFISDLWGVEIFKRLTSVSSNLKSGEPGVVSVEMALALLEGKRTIEYPDSVFVLSVAKLRDVAAKRAAKDL